MEVNSSSGRIEKFNGKPCTISLREFKATFSIVVCELEFKYGANYIEAFTFKQLAHYVYYEELDVYEQHSSRILCVTQIPNLAYATTITTTSQAALQAIIAHHGTMPNNPNPVPISVNFYSQQFIDGTANILTTIDALTFADPMGELFRILELEFLIKSFEFFLQLRTFSWQKDETIKMLYMRFLKLKEDTQNITNLETAHQYLCSLEGTLTLHVKILQRVFVEFGDSYTLLDVYNIFGKVELVHAHYEANTMRPPSCSRPQPPLATPTKLSHSFSRAKVVHLVAPILPSCNYYGNPGHKANECNISIEDLFCDYYGKEGHEEVVCFAKFLEWKRFRLPWQNLSCFSLPFNQKPKHFTLPLSFPHQG
jgi:hypothetical protein